MLIQQSHHPSKISKMSTYHILFHLLADPLTQVMTSVINSSVYKLLHTHTDFEEHLNARTEP